MNDLKLLKQNVLERFDKYHDPAHDVKHAMRVSKIAKKIALGEGYDPLIAEIAGLLHDVGRTIKDRSIPHSEAGVPIAKELLNNYTRLSEENKFEILSAIKHHSDLNTDGLLNNIIQDADKIDGMGALGISRAYLSWSPDYDPDNVIPQAGKYGEFKNAHELISLEIDWFNMLYTQTAKVIAKPRYEFAKNFLIEIEREINESR
jgi:uncharacterized protein